MTRPTEFRHLAHLRHVQAGVLARRQLLEAGVTDNDIERMIRRRQLTVAHPGVYVDHTGPLTRVQRAWCAVLAHWPAALCHESAVPGMVSRELHIAIGLHRTLTPIQGAVLHPMAHLQERTDWRACPPRTRTDHAVIDVMSKRIGGGDVAGAYAALASACFSATNPDRVDRALSRRARVGGRALIVGMLGDLRTGACSVLERGYLTLVERPHGLPRADRQVVSRATGARTNKDVRYRKYGVVVELDGREIHDSPESWDADARRDLAELATAGDLTARVTYGLVFGEACTTACRIGQILNRRGWPGKAHPCPRCTPAGTA